jgi:DNA-binding MarR family transcriptional regulator
MDEPVARKQQKNTENTIASECIAMRLRMLNRVTTRIYDDAMRPLGLRSSQLTILVAAARLGVARPAELSERLQIEVSTLSRNLERMKEKGWLEVVPDEDGRAQPMRLTRKGRSLLERAKPKWDEAQIEIKELLGANAFDTIEEAAQRVRGRDIKK